MKKSNHSMITRSQLSSNIKSNDDNINQSKTSMKKKLRKNDNNVRISSSQIRKIANHISNNIFKLFICNKHQKLMRKAKKENKLNTNTCCIADYITNSIVTKIQQQNKYFSKKSNEQKKSLTTPRSKTPHGFIKLINSSWLNIMKSKSPSTTSPSLSQKKIKSKDLNKQQQQINDEELRKNSLIINKSMINSNTSIQSSSSIHGNNSSLLLSNSKSDIIIRKKSLSEKILPIINDNKMNLSKINQSNDINIVDIIKSNIQKNQDKNDDDKMKPISSENVSNLNKKSRNDNNNNDVIFKSNTIINKSLLLIDEDVEKFKKSFGIVSKTNHNDNNNQICFEIKSTKKLINKSINKIKSDNNKLLIIKNKPFNSSLDHNDNNFNKNKKSFLLNKKPYNNNSAVLKPMKILSSSLSLMKKSLKNDSKSINKSINHNNNDKIQNNEFDNKQKSITTKKINDITIKSPEILDFSSGLVTPDSSSLLLL